MLCRAVLAVTVGGLMLSPTFAQAPRQQYGKWEYNAAKKYHYAKFEYKADPKAAEYSYQYVQYFKDDPKLNNWVYFFNPTTEKVWARYPTVNHPTYGKDVKAGKELWSILPKEKQAKYVADIPAEAYPAPSAKVCPYLPECKDKCQFALPPKDLP